MIRYKMTNSKKRKGNSGGKKEKKGKTELERQMETQHIERMLSQLGLGEGNPDIQLFLSELETFTKTGIAWSGKIPLHGHKRVINAILTNQSNITSSITLQYDPSK